MAKRSFAKRVRKKLRSALRDLQRTFYPQHWWRMWRTGVAFVKDTDRRSWGKVRAGLLTERSSCALIMGNGPSLATIGEPEMARCEREKWLTIGLNRTIYRFATRVLIWSDLETLESILGPESLISSDPRAASMSVVQATLPVGRAWHEQIEKWERLRSFGAFTEPKLFMFRTVLSAALHLCHQLGIRRIVLAGVDLDNRTYFYQNPNYTGSEPYETRSERSLEGHFHGYSTHRIVEEMLKSLMADGFRIFYLGNSSFLSTIDGLQRVEALSDIPATD